MISINHVIIVGTVTGQVFKNKTNTTFRVKTWTTNNDGRTFNTSHDVIVFGKSAEYLPPLSEGDCVHVEGELNRNSYEKDGKTIWTTRIVSRNVKGTGEPQNLGNPDQGAHNGSYPPPSDGGGYRPLAPPQAHGGQQQQPPQQQQQQQPQGQQQNVSNNQDQYGF